jgi:transposase InsO family protein
MAHLKWLILLVGDLAKWLEARGMEHVRGAPYHPQTQGKTERWLQALRQSSPNDNAKRTPIANRRLQHQLQAA